MLPSISIIIPTLNEADNIDALFSRIETSLLNRCIYEIIVIDDYSTDATFDLVKSKSRNIPYKIRVYSKAGQRGKAHSLIEGFQKAKFDLICMLDADLQYPPESILEMLNKIESGFDVVVANRILMDTNIARRSLSHFGRKMYGEWLHGLDCDVQSGMKVFRREILRRISLNPKPWTFDLEFLINSRGAGFRIGTIDIPFSERTAGTSKINILGSGFEILSQAVKMKISGPSVASETILSPDFKNENITTEIAR